MNPRTVDRVAAALRDVIKHCEWADVHATKAGGVGAFAYGRTEYETVRVARAALAEFDHERATMLPPPETAR